MTLKFFKDFRYLFYEKIRY